MKFCKKKISLNNFLISYIYNLYNTNYESNFRKIYELTKTFGGLYLEIKKKFKKINLIG